MVPARRVLCLSHKYSTKNEIRCVSVDHCQTINLCKTRFGRLLLWIVQAMPHNARLGSHMGLYLRGIAWTIPLQIAWQIEFSKRYMPRCLTLWIMPGGGSLPVMLKCMRWGSPGRARLFVLFCAAELCTAEPRCARISYPITMK